MTASTTPTTPWTFDPAVAWQRADTEQTADLFMGLLPEPLADFAVPQAIEVWHAGLAFYPRYRLFCLRRRNTSGILAHCFLLHGPRTLVLDGTSPPIHTANASETPDLTPELSAAYLRFFCTFVHGERGAFRILEDSSLLRDLSTRKGKRHPKQGLVEQVRQEIRPLSAEIDQRGRIHFHPVMVYGSAVFRAHMCVFPTAMVEMLEDEQIVTDLPAEALEPAPGLLDLFGFLPELAQAYHAAGIAPVPPDLVVPAAAKRAAAPSSTGLLDRDITRKYVTVLFAEALARLPSRSLLDLFNANSEDEIVRFARFVLSAWPVVVIESDMPFVEELIADIVRANAATDDVPIARAMAERDDATARLAIPREGHAIVLLPMNTYRGLLDIERVAHEIAIGEMAALIGCHRLAELPEPLRQAADLVVALPDLDEALFRKLFTRIFGQALPTGWRRGGTTWVRYLLPTDLHPAVKLGLKGMAIIRYLRGRVEDRLRQVASLPGPDMKDLHGLTEAKQVAEDLIADIGAALQGRLPWVAVDRGMLLVGPSGTGKTMLARAVAKSCGIRFVAASAAAWQSAGHLGEHLRAMRASFAEARRYAPSILFIDEIDSIGSREHMSGDNGQYHAQVVNGLLELLQGIDESAPVIVLAATNYAERVDPALRRAGRLDRTVAIPYPNVEALATLFQHYLADTAIVGERAGDIDVKALGVMAFGLTGADVESFVRGAARRARKAGRPLAQSDLLAEITGKPRHPDGAGRLTPRDMRAVAVHEAGHALARLLGQDGLEGVAFVSIVPRGDGSLGFVASVPSAHRILDRAQYHDLIEVFLAGRAAEELVFGAMGVGSGAGGPSTRSDLAVATRVATELICHLGMGKSGSLVWSGEPDDAQRAEIDALLKERYASVLQRLGNCRPALDALVVALLERQELTGAELRSLIMPLLRE